MVVVLLVPALLLASTGVANAASRFGDPVPWSFGNDSRFGMGIECDVVSRWKVTDDAQTVLMTGRCTLGWAMVNNWSMGGMVTGKRANGTNSCTALFDTDDFDIGQPWTFETDVIGSGPTADCNVERVCISLTHVNRFTTEANQEFGCQTIGSLGQPQPEPDTADPGDTCDLFTFNRPPRGESSVGQHGDPVLYPGGQARPGATPGNWFKQWSQANPSVTWGTQGTDPGKYALIAPVYENTGSTSDPYVVSVTGYYGAVGNFAFPFGAAVDPTWVHESTYNQPSSQAAQDGKWKVVGIQVFAAASEYGSGFYKGEPFTNRLPQVISTGDVGVTDPGRCRWYYGEKIADIPNSTLDDPAGELRGLSGVVAPGSDTDPVVDPPAGPDPEAGCDGFSLADPSSWGGAAMCAVAGVLAGILGVLGEVLAAIVSIPLAIMNALGALLSALFVPDPAIFSGGIDGLRADYESSVVGEWGETFTGSLDGGSTATAPGARVVAGGGGSILSGLVVIGDDCQGPGVGWERFEDLGLPAVMYPASACADPTKKAASISKVVLAMMIGIGGAMKIFELLMTSIGAGKNLSIMSGDWSSATYIPAGQK